MGDPQEIPALEGRGDWRVAVHGECRAVAVRITPPGSQSMLELDQDNLNCNVDVAPEPSKP